MNLDHDREARGVPIRYILPNLLTTTALCCGLAAVHFSIKAAFGPAADNSPQFGDWDRALASVALSAIFDALDGRAARLLRVTSRFGAVLDSLSDFVSFGVAPALMLYLWSLRGEDALGLAAVVVFTLCSGLRLARFTAMASTKTQLPTPQAQVLKGYFAGCPTPAAAGAVLIPIMLAQSRKVAWTMPTWGVIALTFFVAWLMISRRPMFSFKKVRVKKALVVPMLALVGLAVILTAKDPWLGAAALGGLYVASLPLSMLSYHRAMLRAGADRRRSWSAAPPLGEQIREATRQASG